MLPFTILPMIVGLSSKARWSEASPSFSFFLSFFLWHRLHNLLVHASSERMFYLCEWYALCVLF
jgi:hypothetical protein